MHRGEDSRERHSKCKGPEAGTCLVCVRNIKEASVTRVE